MIAAQGCALNELFYRQQAPATSRGAKAAQQSCPAAAGTHRGEFAQDSMFAATRSDEIIWAYRGKGTSSGLLKEEGFLEKAGFVDTGLFGQGHALCWHHTAGVWDWLCQTDKTHPSVVCGAQQHKCPRFDGRKPQLMAPTNTALKYQGCMVLLQGVHCVCWAQKDTMENKGGGEVTCYESH